VNGDIVIYPAYGTGSFEESEAKKILKKLSKMRLSKREREEKETEKKQRK
jgi:hypothetical protein